VVKISRVKAGSPGCWARATMIMAWCFAGFGLGFYYTEFQGNLVPFDVVAVAAWASSGGILLGAFVSIGVRRRRVRESGLSALAMVACLAFLCAGWHALVEAGDDLRFQWRFERFEQRYEAIIVALRQRGEAPSGRQRDGSIEYVVEPGSPLRVAFQQPGGLLDNWQAVVYDPSGAVLRAREFKRDWSNWDDPSFREIRGLFGGRLAGCRHLRGHYYRCWFT
jgi:hypothetical protein